MPNLILDGTLIEVRMFNNDGVQQGINVVHFNQTAHGGSGLQDSTAAGLLSAAVAALYKPLMATRWQYAGLRLQQLRPVEFPAVVSLTGIGNGTVAGNDVPPQVAGVITKRTNLTGRRGRGRLYCPGICSADVLATGLPQATYITRLGNLAAYLFAPITLVSGADSATLTPVLFGKRLNTQTTVTGFAVRTQLGTQRRRSLINRPDFFGP